MVIPVNQLRARGYRLTPQRLAILRVLNQVGTHRTPQQVYSLALKEIPGITEATVYRTLSFLTTQGLVLEAHVGNGQLVYECAEQVHHHLVCRACQATSMVDYADLQGVFRELEQKTGYQIDSRHVTLLGLCPECRDKTEPAPNGKGDR
jgi:Fur family peroxide stress response transcriptional regulator